MSLIKDSYMKYPMSWVYAGIGAATLFISILTMNNLLAVNEDLTVVDVFGLSMMIFAAFLIVSAYLIYRIDRIESQQHKKE